MTTATVAPVSGNVVAAGFALALVIAFLYGVILWQREGQMDRQSDEIAEHKKQLATLAGRIQSLADFLQVDINDAVDDSPQALADDCPTDEIPICPPTEPDGIPLQVQSALIEQRPSPMPRGKSAEWVEAEIVKIRARIDAAMQQEAS